MGIDREPVEKRLPPIEYFSVSSHPKRKGFRTLYLARLQQGHQHLKRRIATFNEAAMVSHFWGLAVLSIVLSPDQQYYCITGASQSIIGQTGQPPFKTIDDAFYGRFSPDSRYLLGYRALSGDLELVDCRRRRTRRLTEANSTLDRDASKEYFYHFGWYPDGRAVWFRPDWITPTGPLPERYYRLELTTGRKQVLGAAQSRQLHTDWQLLNPRYRYCSPFLQGNRLYAYSRDGRWRVRVEPYYPYSVDHPEDRARVYVEQRGGGSRLVVQAERHGWAKVYPQDVSVDGRWVLLIVERWGADGDGQRVLQGELVAVEVARGTVLYPLVKGGKRVVQFVRTNQLEPAYWFSK